MKMLHKATIILIIGMGATAQLLAMDGDSEEATEESSSCLSSTRGAQEHYNAIKAKLTAETLTSADLQSFPWNEKGMNCALRKVYADHKDALIYDIKKILNNAGILTEGFPTEFHSRATQPMSWQQYYFAEACLAILETFIHPGDMELLRLSTGLNKLRDKLVSTEAARATQALRGSWTTTSSSKVTKE